MHKFIIANWKSNKNIAGARQWFKELNDNSKLANLFRADKFDNLKLILAPSYPLLAEVQAQLENTNLNIDLAVQDLSPYPAGAYMGAVCAYNLEGFDLKYAIVGHSERRRYFYETHQDIARKVEQAVGNQITPILCLDEADIKEQANQLDKKYYQKCLIAYEPITAISTEAQAKNADVGKVKSVIDKIKKIYGEKVLVIYGGSVAEQNVNEYLMVSDGVLVGGASLSGQQFAQLVQQAAVSD